MKKCFDYPSYYCRSDLSFQVGTQLGCFNTVSSVKIITGVYRNCCKFFAKAEQWARGGMVDTPVLGTGPQGWKFESSLAYQLFFKMGLKKMMVALLMCVDAIKVWGNLLELPKSKKLDLGSR